MKKQQRRWKLPVKQIIFFIIIFLALYASVVYIRRTLRSLPYFKIKNIIVNEGSAEDFFYFKGRDIFALDLRKESRYIAELYPYYEKVRLIRILPNSLFVDFVKRKPVALVKLSRFFYVDEKLILWSVDERPGAQRDDPYLPVITGLESRILSPEGRIYGFPELMFAVELIKEVSSNKALENYKIGKIDLKNPNNISFYIAVNPVFPPVSKKQGTAKCADVEVKVSPGDIKERNSILAGLFQQFKNDLCNIKYIDLRFKEPVIKFYDAQ